jgi:HK97 family phage portal protein
MTTMTNMREFDYEARELADVQEKSAGSIANLVQGIGLGGRWATDDTTFLDPMYLKALFENEDWVYITVDLIAMKISNQYLRVMKQEVRDGKPVIDPAEGHPVQKMIDFPNEFQDYHAWMYTTVIDLTLIGNAIQWFRRDAQKIYNIPAETVHIDFDGVGRIKQYRSFESVDKEGMSVPLRQWVFAATDVIHYRKPNPGSMIWGLSPFLAGQRAILFNRYSTEYLNSFYQKGASPSMVLEMGEMANETNALRLLRSFEAAYTGRRNQRRPLVTPKGVTAKAISHSLADQQLKDYIAQNRETILALLKIPPHEVGLQKSGSLGSEEYKSALKNFWAATLKPMMKIIAGGMSLGLKEFLGPDHFLEFDLSDVDILQEDKKQKADLANAMLTTRTLNEVREDVWNDEPLEGGDKTPGAVVPAFPQFGQQMFQQFATPQKVETVPVQEQTMVESKEIQTTDPSIDDVIKQRSEMSDRWIKANDSWFKQRERKIETGTAKAEPGIYKLTLDMFEAQTIAALKEVKKYLKDDKGYVPMTHGFRIDHVGARKSWVTKAEIKDKAELKKRIRTAMDSFKGPWEKGYVKTLEPTLDLGRDVALDVPFGLPDQEQIEAIGARNAKKRRQILAARGLRGFAQMSDTSTERIMSIIEQGVTDGVAVNKIASNIADEMTNVPNIQSRAETIARTETLTALSIGQAAAMQDAAKVIPDLKKMWIATNDDRTRGLKANDKYDHAGLNGQIVDHDKDFKDSRSGQELPYPRAPGADAGMVINCRCTWVMLPAEEMGKIEAPELTVEAEET